MNNKRLAEHIVCYLGGKENIASATHCVTRLRFQLVNEEKVQIKDLEGLDGVLGYTLQGGQHQVIIGTTVKAVYDEVMPLLNETLDSKAVQTKQTWSIMNVFGVLTSIIAPIIPAFCAAGMMKCISLLLVSFHLCTGEEGAYQLFAMISDVAFYFLPILIAMSAGKRFKVDQGLAVCVAGALLYPSFIALVNEGQSLEFFGLPVPMFSYASTIFPALLGVWALSYVYRFFDKLIKLDAIKLLLVPLLSLAITIPFTMLLLAPLGNWGAEVLGSAFAWMIQTMGPFAGLVIGFLMPIMTLTGLHQSLAPIELLEITTGGYSLILGIEFLHNLAESGAALGTAIVTKDKSLKATAVQTGFTAFIGISEPALYTVMVKNRVAMVSAMIANGIGSFFGVLFMVKCYAYVWPNIFSIPTFMDGTNNVVLLILCAVITFVIAFALPIAIGFFQRKTTTVYSPVSGMIHPLTSIPDEVFSKGLCGDGIVIEAQSDIIVAPCDGEVLVAMNHAVGIKEKNGSELLIHIGTNTNVLDESYLHTVVKQGEYVKKGQTILLLNREKLQQHGYGCSCIVLCTNRKIKKEKEGCIKETEMLYHCVS